MPRYFFDTFDGNAFIPDEDGQDINDIDTASRIAQEALPQMVRDALPDGDQRTYIVSVRDEEGRTVIRAALSLIVEYPSQAED